MPPFEDAEVVHLEVGAIRSNWAHILRWCIDWRAHEYPLYALFSSMFTALCNTTTGANSGVSPSTDSGPILFSYPQCRLVSKKMARKCDDSSISAIPDFAFMHSHILEPSDQEFVRSDGIKMLVEIKRLHDESQVDPWFWADVDKSNDAVQNAFNFSIRQLLLQAYCAFNAFDGDTVYIIFICGVYFSLFRFTRPGYLLPFPEEEMVEAGPSSKKRRLDDQHEEHQHEENQHEEHRHEEHHNVLKKFKRATDIKNPQLSQMLPLNCVEVVYHGVPVFEDIRAPKVHLSDGFRQALRDCLAGIDLQPCSLFELQTVQFSQGEKERGPGVRALAAWYNAANGVNQTPPRRTDQKSVYDESSPIVHQRTGEVVPGPSPGTKFIFKGGKFDIQPRRLPPRQAKIDSNKPADGSDVERDSEGEAREEDRGEGETKEGMMK